MELEKGGFCCNNFKSLIIAKFATDAIQSTKTVNAEVITEEMISMFKSYVIKEQTLEYNDIKQDFSETDLNANNFSIADQHSI